MSVSGVSSWAVLAGLCLYSQPALSCACCDWEETRQPLAWSADGLRLAVEVQRTGCNPIRGLEVWATGRDAPSVCYDLLAPDPNTPTDCGEWTVDLHRSASSTALVGAALSNFTHVIGPPPPQALGRLRMVDGEGAHLYRFERKAGEGWQEIWRGTLTQADHAPADNRVYPRPLVARLLPALAGDSGVLWIQHVKGPEPEGMNVWVDQIHWVAWGGSERLGAPEPAEGP